ncbi:hypothetical protein [Halosimplex pelagicum]|uniref:DUF2085 domain-containing protein n=1 Tax=Halosimplex pelagicum TaxID=869886 RepID=A0A7D5P9D8_9EURY|nr:hypothetical protein [Halosimplex pelagicum]QLH84046.1 hypothetical protein HZS54_21465 [Halosimplex pelagicum]
MNYEPPDLREFTELRRGLPVVAAVMLVVAPVLPMWHIAVDAVQYPDTTLHLHLHAYPFIGGDYEEMAALNHYIGFYYPDPGLWQPNYDPHPYAVDVPEWSLGPFAFAAVAAAGLFVAFAPDTDRLKRGLTYQLVGSITVLTVMLADIQYRLYQAGHNLDPDAPVMGVDGFTPPLWGSYEVANITSRSRFGAGAYLTGLAIGLLVVAFYYRDTPTTFGDLPDRVSGRIDGAREWLDENTVGDDEWEEGDDQRSRDERDRDDRSGPGPSGGD